MPICHTCSQSYEPTEEACPKCGTANPRYQKAAEGFHPPRPRCGQAAVICLWYAFGVSLLIPILAVVSAVEALNEGNLARVVVNLLVAAPAGAGVAIALRLAIRYAKGED